MNIALPEALLDWVAKQTAQGGFASADAFVEDVLCREQQRQILENRLLASLASGPPIEVTPSFWQQRRQVLEKRLRQSTHAEGP
jgi:hypothetical protein